MIVGIQLIGADVDTGALPAVVSSAIQTMIDESVAGLGVQIEGILDSGETPPNDGIWLVRPAP